MKHRATLILIFISSWVILAFAQLNTHADHELIASLVCLEKENPDVIEGFFRSRKINDHYIVSENYGFGYRMQRTEINGEHIVITGTFYYFNDSIISYTLDPKGPWKKELIESYKKWYGDYFSYSGDEIQPYRYKHEQLCKPIKEYSGSYSTEDIPKEIMEYMSPESGTVFGYSCGFLSTEPLKNRKNFYSIEDSLTTDQLELLMYSINPVSRLTAIEYYFNHKDRFERFSFYNDWLNRNFVEIPEIKTCFGDVSQMRNTKLLFQGYIDDRD